MKILGGGNNSNDRGSGVARFCCEEGQSWKVGYGAVTANFRTARWLIVLWVQYWSKRAVGCWHLHQLISQTTQ